ncbi:hypothetical protein [Methanoculleus bourgensis]|uniref:hypothetical protein n=1 Tax=Methanoculleus bourgensis TaxID=83986 RepID=UPI0024908673|nr:hypothetical protein [Methanoculleus bourgensis]
MKTGDGRTIPVIAVCLSGRSPYREGCFHTSGKELSDFSRAPLVKEAFQPDSCIRKKIISYWMVNNIHMRIIEVSDTIYQEILSRRRGREPISKTLERELMQSKIKGDIKKLDADIARSEKTKRYSSEQMKERLGL